MKIATVMGSPKRHGKTAAALEFLEKKLMSQGHEIDRINVTDYHINGCLGCYACMQNKYASGCIQKDDTEQVFMRIISADAVIYASPLYSFDLTAQLKPLVDRSFSLTNTPLLDGKRVALLITCAGQEEGNADLVQEFFRRSFDGENKGMFHTKLVGEFIIPFSDASDFSDRARKTADDLARAILNDL
ncbi:flavodoxin family protein [Lacrimispora sp. 38-1]|uniref:flavodoxin family protein n=1 Tax=Lacrimispora sp. 38-1 TaxID=3125778 RepID=UPI003CEE6D1F